MTEIDARRVAFHSDGLTLEGLLTEPATRTIEVGAVLCHPHPLHGGEMRNHVISKIARALVEAGMPVLRFNFRGVGRSEGEYSEGVGEARDVTSAIAWFKGELNLTTVDLVGYSFGSVVGMAAGGDDKNVRRMAMVAPPVSTMEMGQAGHTEKPKLFLRGSRDSYCEPDAFSNWYGTLPEPKSFVTLDGADHFFRGFEATLAKTVAGFFMEGAI